MPPTADSKPPKERNQTGHARLVGFVLFVVLTALALSPFFPGKILDNFPGSSQSFSTGDQGIPCISTLGPVKTSVKYDSKNGFPIVYGYSTTSTIQATCAGKSESATGGHSSQFNPLGLAIDIVAALAIAIVVAKLWRTLFSRGHAKY